jgi:hypothetical protein
VSYIDFGCWDLNPSAFINSPPLGAQPSTPLRLSQEQETSPGTSRDSTLTPQLAIRTLPFHHSVSPIQEDIHFLSPELTYPDSPVQCFPFSNARSEVATSIFQSPILAPIARSTSVSRQSSTIPRGNPIQVKKTPFLCPLPCRPPPHH